jgi:hypothetical protein
MRTLLHCAAVSVPEVAGLAGCGSGHGLLYIFSKPQIWRRQNWQLEGQSTNRWSPLLQLRHFQSGGTVWLC